MKIIKTENTVIVKNNNYLNPSTDLAQTRTQKKLYNNEAGNSSFKMKKKKKEKKGSTRMRLKK